MIGLPCRFLLCADSCRELSAIDRSPTDPSGCSGSSWGGRSTQQPLFQPAFQQQPQRPSAPLGHAHWTCAMAAVPHGARKRINAIIMCMHTQQIARPLYAWLYSPPLNVCVSITTLTIRATVVEMAAPSTRCVTALQRSPHAYMCTTRVLGHHKAPAPATLPLPLLTAFLAHPLHGRRRHRVRHHHHLRLLHQVATAPQCFTTLVTCRSPPPLILQPSAFEPRPPARRAEAWRSRPEVRAAASLLQPCHQHAQAPPTPCTHPPRCPAQHHQQRPTETGTRKRKLYFFWFARG